MAFLALAIQSASWQKLRRFLVPRCAGCGKRFKMGKPDRLLVDPPKPKMFCSEVDIYHSGCAGMSAALDRPEATRDSMIDDRNGPLVVHDPQIP